MEEDIERLKRLFYANSLTQYGKRKLINYYEQHGMEETMAEYGVPTKSAVHQRLTWYKNKLK